MSDWTEEEVWRNTERGECMPYYPGSYSNLAPAYEDVREFHRACGLTVMDCPALPSPFMREEIALRGRLLHEEYEELVEGLEEMDIAAFGSAYGNWDEGMTAIADAIADLIYVLLGTAATFGLPMAEIWRRVHESNMAKVRNGVIRRADGKILKPEGWEPPDVAGAIRDAMDDL